MIIKQIVLDLCAMNNEQECLTVSNNNEKAKAKICYDRYILH